MDEKDEVIDQDVYNEPEDTIEVDSTNLTVDDYIKEKQRREKAEKLLVELKKANKELKTKVPQGEYITKTELELNRLIDKEPELADYADDITSYVNKGLSVKEATLLVKASDKAITNRQKMENLSITGGEQSATKSSYTPDQLEKLSQKDYEKFMDKVDKGEATIL